MGMLVFWVLTGLQSSYGIQDQTKYQNIIQLPLKVKKRKSHWHSASFHGLHQLTEILPVKVLHIWRPCFWKFPPLATCFLICDAVCLKFFPRLIYYWWLPRTLNCIHPWKCVVCRGKCEFCKCFVSDEEILFQVD